jgi:hypothetical protein
MAVSVAWDYFGMSEYLIPLCVANHKKNSWRIRQEFLNTIRKANA